jgi:hypothetical protein
MRPDQLQEAMDAEDMLTEVLSSLRHQAERMGTSRTTATSVFVKVQVGRALDTLNEAIASTEDARDTLRKKM